MDSRKLKNYLINDGLTVEKLVERMRESGVKITKQTFYNKLKGKTEFNRVEIISLIKILQLSDAQVFDIFFS